MPIFFAASMIAYLISQFFDVWFFEFISKLTNRRFLWLRNNLSTITSSLIDNFIFSIFAWIIFNPNPLNFSTVFFYIYSWHIHIKGIYSIDRYSFCIFVEISNKTQVA